MGKYAAVLSLVFGAIGGVLIACLGTGLILLFGPDTTVAPTPCAGARLAECRAVPRETADAHSANGCAGVPICLVPVGAISNELLVSLVSYYKERGIHVGVLPPLELTIEADPARHQIEIESVRALIEAHNHKVNRYPNVLMIGLLPADIYDASIPHWRFAFGASWSFSNSGRVQWQAVISTFRMDPMSYGESPNEALKRSRVLKLMNKYVARTYFGVPLSSDPKSATYNNILSVRDLDRMSPDLPTR